MPWALLALPRPVCAVGHGQVWGKARAQEKPRAVCVTGEPALHGVAVQAGGVCVQRFARQRQPRRGGHGHPRHHEQEPHRWVTGSGHPLCLPLWSHPEPQPVVPAAGLGWRSPLPALSQGEAAAVPALAGQAPTGCGAAPSWQGSRDTWPRVLWLLPWGIGFLSQLECRGGSCCGFVPSVSPDKHVQ